MGQVKNDLLIPGAVVRQRPVQLVSAEVWRAAGEIVRNRRKNDAGIDGARAWFQTEIEIVGLVEMLRCGSDLSGMLTFTKTSKSTRMLCCSCRVAWLYSSSDLK